MSEKNSGVVGLLVKRLERLGNNVRAPMRGTSLGSLSVAQIEPPKTERARIGARFNAVNGNGSTFLAPIQAFPTTTATMLLYNPEPDGGKSYAIDQAYAFLASGTPDVGGALLGCISQEKCTAPTKSTGQNGSYANVVISGLAGKSGGASRGLFATAQTLLSTPAWFPVDSKPQATATAKIAAAVYHGEVQGGACVPPGFGFGLVVLAGAGTTPLFGFGVVWDEMEFVVE